MPQIRTTSSGWADVYALASAASVAEGGPAIPVGTPLLVQNQSSDRASFQIRSTAPDVTDNTGRWLASGVEAVVTSGAAGCYMRGGFNGVQAYVQVNA
jgi:hypothetical protein